MMGTRFRARVAAGVLMVAATGSVMSSAQAAPSEGDVKCLSDNIYLESRDDGPPGWSAVGHVTVNRWHEALRAGRRVSVCGIVYEGANRGRHRCQFSWACDGRLKAKSERETARAITRFARELLAGEHADQTAGATYFHERGRHPRWASDGSTKLTVAIGRHYYYRAAHQTEGPSRRVRSPPRSCGMPKPRPLSILQQAAAKLGNSYN